MSESDSGNKQELKGVRIPNPKTLTGDGEDRGAKRVNTWINRVQDWIEITNTQRQISHEYYSTSSKDQLWIFTKPNGKLQKQKDHRRTSMLMNFMRN
jgi:hypothetical protein